MASSSGTVTLEKAYFETLLRRAQFHAPAADFTTPRDVLTVTIPKSDHDSLLNVARQYANLQTNLLQGGITEETLAILTRGIPGNEDGATTTASAVEESSDAGFFSQQPMSTVHTNGAAQDYTFGRNANYTPRNTETRQRETNGYKNGYQNGFQNHSNSDDNLYMSMPEGPEAFYDGGSFNESQQKPRQQFDKFAKRTVLLANLHEATTHGDIVDVVRGGMLLDIYLRGHDRTASVSFLHEVDAQEFFRHAKRYDLYVRGKRVEIRWNDRQFILPGHVANKVAIGATRNLVIINRSPRHTEEMIRDDLEHIHNLVVIRVSFDDNNNNAYISTNSVHNAMFARTCMMSRAVYKGSKIEWDTDECSAPLERRRQPNVISKETTKKEAPLMNRFQLLNMDGDEESLEDDEDNQENHLNGVSVQPPVSFMIS